MAPGQFVPLAELSSRLPPPTPPGQAVADDAAPTVDAPAATLATADAAPVTDAALAPASAAVDQDAPPPSLKPAPAHPASKQVARLVRKPSHPVAVAAREPRPAEGDHEQQMMHGTPLPLAGLPQGRPHVMSAMARPALLPAPRPAAVSAYPAAIGSGIYVHSALGGSGSLPPPVPLQ
jgi:hypothetical protein